MNDAITVERAGEILGCSRRRVFQLLADGTLERAPRYGRRVRVYLASRRGRARPTEAAQRDEAPSVTRGVRPRGGATVTDVVDTLTLYPPRCPHGFIWRRIGLVQRFHVIACAECSKPVKFRRWFEDGTEQPVSPDEDLSSP